MKFFSKNNCIILWLYVKLAPNLIPSNYLETGKNKKFLDCTNQEQKKIVNKLVLPISTITVLSMRTCRVGMCARRGKVRGNHTRINRIFRSIAAGCTTGVRGRRGPTVPQKFIRPLHRNSCSLFLCSTAMLVRRAYLLWLRLPSHGSPEAQKIATKRRTAYKYFHVLLCYGYW